MGPCPHCKQPALRILGPAYVICKGCGFEARHYILTLAFAVWCQVNFDELVAQAKEGL